MRLPALHHAPLRYLADSTPAPLDPRSPGKLPGHLGTATDTLIGWTITGSLIACALGFIAGGALLGIGNLTERPEHGARGKRAMIWSCVAAALIGAVWGLLDNFYALGQ